MIAGESEPSNASHKRAMESRIRNRVYTGLRDDGRHLCGLDSDLRASIFDGWKNRAEEEAVDEGPEDPDTFWKPAERYSFEKGLTDLLTFLYLGNQESGLRDFEELLEEAIEQAAHEQGRELSSFELTTEFETPDTPSPEELAAKFRAGGDLRISQVRTLYEEGYLNDDDLEGRAPDPDGPLGWTHPGNQNDDTEN